MNPNSTMGDGMSPMPNQNNTNGMNGMDFGGQQQFGQAATSNFASNNINTNSSMLGTQTMPMQQNYGAAPNMSMPTPATQSTPAPSATSNTAPVAVKNEKRGFVETIILVVVCLIAAGAIVLDVIFYLRWNELNTDFESEVAIQSAEVEKNKQEEINQAIQNYANKTTTEFMGPSDYGSISFQYPTAWSVYEASDGSKNSDYEAFFRPEVVSPVNDKASRYALRFSILNRSFEDVSRPYENKVKNGELTMSTFTADSGKISGARYEGMIDNDINGVVIIVKINDKAAIFQTDSVTYKANFDALIETLRKNS